MAKSVKHEERFRTDRDSHLARNSRMAAKKSPVRGCLWDAGGHDKD
jgi:hypothetical protein